MSIALESTVRKSLGGRVTWKVAIGVVASLVAATLGAIFLVAPEESTMGPVQRVVYLHVAVAWCGLCGCILMGIAGVMYLTRRESRWDRVSQSAGEIGWLCSSLTLATGSLWAHAAWGAWWTWDPRLTTTLILWTLYAGYFLVRGSVDEPRRRARISAVLAVLATADVPLVIFATRWFRGIHPVTPEMDPRMRMVLLASIAGFSSLFALLGVVRFHQLKLRDQLAERELEFPQEQPE